MERNDMGRKNKQKRKEKKTWNKFNLKKEKQITQKEMEMKTMNNYKTTTTTTWQGKADCHSGQRVVFTTHDGIEILAGGKNRSGGWHKAHPLPQLAIGPDETMASPSVLDSKTIVPQGWSCEQHLTNLEPPLFVYLDFPDFGTPAVNKYFWYALVDDIREHGIKSVSTQCAGGHGRTGVQLAILRYLLATDDERATYTDAGVLIDWVRSVHCTHAVETKGQQQYIAMVCDIPVGENKIHGYSYGGYSYGGGKSFYNNQGADTGKVTTATTTSKATTLYDDWDDIEWKSSSRDKYDDEVVTCECCDSPSFDMISMTCSHCDYDVDYAESSLKSTCEHCFKSRPYGEFIEGDFICLQCHADAMGVKHKEHEVHCSTCNKMIDNRFISHIDGIDTFICRKCNAELTSSEEQ